MWWCCGQTKVTALGCKFAKHESKEDEEEEEEQRAVETRLKHKRCMCCRETGHRTNACTHDPNIRTNFEVEDEAVRVNKIREFKKVGADSVVATTSLLHHFAHQGSHIENAFGMGVLAFDDYNYNYYNKQLLIHERELLDMEDKQPTTLINKPTGEGRLSQEILHFLIDKQGNY